jgi:hypothetical protein
METRAIELYNELRQIDASSFWIYGIEEKKIPKLILHHSRYIGSELDRSLKHIFYHRNKTKGPSSVNLHFEVNQNSDEKIKCNFYLYKHRGRETFEDFNIKEYVKNYNFQSEFNYGIENEDEISQCQKYLNELHEGINIDAFTSNNRFVNNIQIKGFQIVHGDFSRDIQSEFISGLPDLILDNRLLDIKADVNINGRKPKYVAQILFYYFLIQIFKDSTSQNNEVFDILDINKIGFYYATYDKLIEIDVDSLLPNKTKLMSLIKHELIYGNFFIRDIIEKSLLKTALTPKELTTLESSIIERKVELFQTWDRRNVKRFEKQLKIHDFALDHYKNRLSVSRYSVYEKQMKLKIRETELSLEDAKLFVLEIDNEIQEITFNMIDKFLSSDKLNNDSINNFLDLTSSNEFRRLIVNKRLLNENIMNFENGNNCDLNLTELQKRLKQINKEIKTRCKF